MVNPIRVKLLFGREAVSGNRNLCPPEDTPADRPRIKRLFTGAWGTSGPVANEKSQSSTFPHPSAG